MPKRYPMDERWDLDSQGNPQQPQQQAPDTPYDPFAPGENGDYNGPPTPQRPGPSGFKRVLAQLGLNLSQSLGNSLYAHLSPEAFQAEQQAKRQREDLDQQLRLHNTLTPYERLQLKHQNDVEQRQKQEHADAMAQQQFEQMLHLAGGIANGSLQQLQTPGTVSNQITQQPQGGTQQLDPGAQVQDGGSGDYLTQILSGLPQKGAASQMVQAPPLPPNAMQAGGLAAVAKPQQEHMVNPPPGSLLESLFGKQGIPLDKLSEPLIAAYEREHGRSQALADKTARATELGKTALTQIDQLVDAKDPLKTTYQYLVQDAVQSGDPNKVTAIVDDIRKQKEEVTTEKRKLELQFSPDAIQGNAKLASARKSAEDSASYDFTKKHLWEQMPGMLKEIENGGVSYQDLIGRIGPMGKLVFDEYIGTHGGSVPVALSSQALGKLGAMEPVLDSLKLVKNKIAPYAKNSAPMGMLIPRLKYELGIGDDQGGLISTGEMDRLRGAAQSLSGLQTGEHVLAKAEIHTPNFWKDSGKLMNDKVDNMINYLESNIKTIRKYGAKNGMVGAGSRAPIGDSKPDVDVNNVLKLTPSDEELLRKLKSMKGK